MSVITMLYPVDVIINALDTNMDAAIATLLAELMPGEDVDGETWGDRLGELAGPALVTRLTEDLPELQTPAVLVELIETLHDPYWTPHEDLTYPLAVHVVGWWESGHKAATDVAAAYAEVMCRVLRQYAAPGGGALDWIDINDAVIEDWGEGAHGRAVVVRATGYRWAVEATGRVA